MSQSQNEEESEQVEPERELIPGGWRNATDELPEPGTEVEVAATVIRGHLDEDRTTLRATYVGDEQFDVPGEAAHFAVRPDKNGLYARVTHWAPTPTLPERLEEMPERGDKNRDTDKRIRQMEPHQ